jgi:hypothetical protein
MGRLKDIDAEMHELPDSVKEAQETLDKTKNMRAYVLGFEAGEEAEKQRILNILSNKGLELEKDVSWDDEASHIRYVFMIDILELLRGYR